MDTKEIIQTTLISEHDIIQRILKGEKDFYEILMRRYNQLLYRVIRGYIKEDNIAEDIMQDTYIKAYQKLDQYKGKSAFSTWLIRIGINESLMHIRKTKRKGKVLMGGNANEIISFQDKIHPEIKMIYSESGYYIEKAIDELPAKLRVVFNMIEVEGLTIDTVSKCLDLTTVNVKVRLHRAKKILQGKLSQLSDIGDLYAYGSNHCDIMVKNVMNIIPEKDSFSSENAPQKRTIMRRILNLGMIGLFGLVLFNCSSKENNITKDFKKTPAQLCYVDDVPQVDLDADLPIFQPSQRTFINYLDFNTSENVYVRQNTTMDNKSKIIDFYKENLPKNGWTINPEKSTEEKMTIQKGNRYATIRLFEMKQSDTVILAYSINLVRPKLALQSPEVKSLGTDKIMHHDE